MKISFIIPVYNCGKYLSNCINYIRQADIDDYEIVIVDDGSTDESPVICNSFADEHVKVFHQKNQGVSAARNKGISISKGEYILFVDADDGLEPELLHELIAELEHNPIDMAVFGHTFDYYKKGKCYRNDFLSTSITGVIKSEEWLERIPELFSQNALSPIWNKIIKRSLIAENSLELRRDMFMYEDLEFSLRCMAHCDEILFSDKVIYHYRQAEDEGNAGRRLKRIEHVPDIINKIDDAVEYMAQKHGVAEHDKARQILVPLYLVLAREKNNVSDTEQIKTVCGDFSAWAENCGLELPKDNEYCNMLLNGQTTKIIVKRAYTAIRHKIAVAAKSSGLYKR